VQSRAGIESRHILEGNDVDVLEVLAHTEWWNEIAKVVQVPESIPCENDSEQSA